MVDFFIDTANIDAINNIWKKIKTTVYPNNMLGITTNPNAFKKINMFSLKEWEIHLPKICEVVSKIRNDDKGVVYVQTPVSTMRSDEILRFAAHIFKFTDGNTRLGLKLPPFKHALEIINDLEEFINTNVTGVADVATAMYAHSYYPTYISIIPGRMEEVGIDAKSQLRYLMNAKLYSGIIAGSMRTLDGLKWVSEMGTVPTIGEKVWDLIFNNMNILHEIKFNKESLNQSIQHFSPTINNINTDLSIAFFKQMDEYGEKCKQDFLTAYNI